ncbi:phosphate/phosphite/phosphonate ABC transporter substrate-binding protein [Paraburkholderia sartisoli]|uniref:ABC-type phosphate/phosphonate transport system, substrate-binding protein n=1 Tax=Paraburkholderia sartisoli TaxID=83784 RepID=A0A1H4FB75_9BURK|nr:PhnD/SsuA/transferrin family substrate-binding protein [Paraburkholderia sartisoli]SEA94573.1 ABC-type phosphate/phosphonate transport system, substrate-binding protein [Paraburkholderia sartisoli]
MNWIASLPMYNVTPALAADWRAFLADVLREAAPLTRIVEADESLDAFWRRADLLISQTCGYPLMHGLHEHVQLIATPEFDAPGCVGPNYSSVIVTRADGPVHSLDASRGLRVAFNQPDSNSGMNALRHAIAPLSRDGSYFGEAVVTGSHVGSLMAIAENRADIAAIDCVTMAFVRDGLPRLARAVREVAWTQASPGLPLVASNNVDASTVEALRSALDNALHANPVRTKRLRLKGFSRLSLTDYARIEQLENEALTFGYTRLA